MKFSNLEVFLLLAQLIVIPILHSLFRSIKKDILDITKEIVREHYLSLDSLIDASRVKIEEMKTYEKHKESLLKIYLKQLSYRILDIETYLAKEGYSLRTRGEGDDDISGFV